MKRWYWLILELLIIFGVIAWICFFPSDFEYDFAKGMVGFVLIYTIENYTIEQNAWENQIEGGVVSVSGSAKKTELKEVHESDKRSLALIAKKGADFEKAYNEAEELLDKQIEATYKLFEENKELKEKLGDVQMQKAGEKSDLVWKLKTANEQKADQLTYAKTIIQDLLDNTDEYARQKAEDFLKESE